MDEFLLTRAMRKFQSQNDLPNFDYTKKLHLYEFISFLKENDYKKVLNILMKLGANPKECDTHELEELAATIALLRPGEVPADKQTTDNREVEDNSQDSHALSEDDFEIVGDLEEVHPIVLQQQRKLQWIVAKAVLANGVSTKKATQPVKEILEVCDQWRMQELKNKLNAI